MRVLLVAYDNASSVSWFPQSLAAVAAVLREDGHEVTVYNQDVHHRPDAHLTAYLDAQRFDLVGLSFVAGYYQYRKAMALGRAVNASRQRPFFVLGGHGPTPEPAFFLERTGADAVLLGEGEVAVRKLVDALAAGRPLAEVPSLAYRDGGEVRTTPRAPLVADLDSLPRPAYELFPVEQYRLLPFPNMAKTDFSMPILSGRGCRFHCNFCYRMDEGMRLRSPEAIVDEIRFLRRAYGINYIAFADELLMTSADRTVELCEAFLRADLGMKWDCNGRLNFARPEVLDLMKRSGCVFINYGIECMDDTVLKRMGKALTTGQVVRGVEATLAADISPGLNIIFGNLGENRQTLEKGVQFLLTYDDGAQLRTIRPVTPYPGCPLYDYAIEHGLLDGPEDFYERKHLNSDLPAVNFTELSDDEVHEALYEANRRLLENYYANACRRAVQTARRLYRERDTSFRGFRHV